MGMLRMSDGHSFGTPYRKDPAMMIHKIKTKPAKEVCPIKNNSFNNDNYFSVPIKNKFSIHFFSLVKRIIHITKYGENRLQRC